MAGDDLPCIYTELSPDRFKEFWTIDPNHKTAGRRGIGCVFAGGSQKLMRRRSSPGPSFEERLAKAAAEARERAEQLPPGIERQELLDRAASCDMALTIGAWVRKGSDQQPARLNPARLVGKAHESNRQQTVD